MNIYFKNEFRRSRDSVVDEFVEYIEKINKGCYVGECFGYQGIDSKKIYNQAKYLAMNDGVDLIDKKFLNFIRNKNNLNVLTTSHSSFYVSFGYRYEIDYTVNYKYSKKVVSGYDIKKGYYDGSYYTTENYREEYFSDSYNKTKKHSAVGVIQINSNGKFTGECLTEECDDYYYWPSWPQRSRYFKGDFEFTTLDQIKKDTFYDDLVIPSEEEIIDYIETYCDNYSLHSNVVSSDRNDLEYDFNCKYRYYGSYYLSSDCNKIRLTKTRLRDTFNYIVENYYTYKLYYTYCGEKYEFDPKDFSYTFSEYNCWFLPSNSEIYNYTDLAKKQLQKQADESKERSIINIKKTDELDSILSKRHRTYFIMTSIISLLYILSFVGSIIYPHYYPLHNAPFFVYPISYNQLAVALTLFVLYLVYYFSKYKFYNYRSSAYKSWNGQVQVIQDYYLDTIKHREKVFKVIFIIFYVLTISYLIVLIFGWVLLISFLFNF